MPAALAEVGVVAALTAAALGSEITRAKLWGGISMLGAPKATLMTEPALGAESARINNGASLTGAGLLGKKLGPRDADAYGVAPAGPNLDTAGELSPKAVGVPSTDKTRAGAMKAPCPKLQVAPQGAGETGEGSD